MLDAGNAIEVRNVRKSFKVYYDKGHTLKEKALFADSKKYKEREVLKEISFQIKKGEAVGLIGSNGCGKSTTLKLLTKIMYPDSGTVELSGRVSSLLELGAGFHPDMTGRENVYINASIFGLGRKEIDRRMNDIIDFSELGEFIDNPVRTYSSGMYMRLAFSVAINVDADILLIDEILAVGDVNFQSKCFERLVQIKENHTTIVLVSHSLDQIEKLCSRSIWIQDGFVKMDGKAAKVDQAYLAYMEAKREALQSQADGSRHPSCLHADISGTLASGYPQTGTSGAWMSVDTQADRQELDEKIRKIILRDAEEAEKEFIRSVPGKYAVPCAESASPEKDMVQLAESSRTDTKQEGQGKFSESEKLLSVIYFDRGQGFQEEDSAAAESCSNAEGAYVCEYEAAMPAGLTAVRFDPVEGRGCVIREFEASVDGEILTCRFPDSLGMENGIFLFSNDPMIEAEGLERTGGTDGSIGRLYIHAVFTAEGTASFAKDVKAVSRETRRELCVCRNKLVSLQGLYEEVSRHDAAVSSGFALAKQQAGIWQHSYEDMLNSRSWRLSRPLRIPGRLRERLRAQPQQAQPHEKIRESVKFSILMPVYNVRIGWLKKAIASIQRQKYKNWELCIADDASTDAGLREYLSGIRHKKIKIELAQENGGISAATNLAARMAAGDYFLLMDHDDEIAEDALYEFARCIRKTDADIIYSDQDMIDEQGNHSCPLYKPDWSPDLLRSQMYIGHLCGFKKQLFAAAGGFRKEYDGSQDYDLLLRMTEHAGRIEHIPKILYHWRSLPTSTAANADAKPYAQAAGLRALQAHLDRVYGEGKAQAAETDNLFVYDVTYAAGKEVLVSIIIPTKDFAQDLKIAVDSIFEQSTYRNFEIIILNNNSEEAGTYAYFKEVQKAHVNVKVVDAFYEFNWSKLNNHGMREAAGDVYIFLNNDVRILSSDWMERLTGKAVREGTGAVGAMLLYDDGTIQHAGVVAGLGGWADHVFKAMLPRHCGTPFVSPVVVRNVMAVTGACMAVSRKVVEQIGGFDERFVICGSDVEFCIRGYQAGLVNVYDPGVRLFHFESKSRGTRVSGIDFELSKELYSQFCVHGDPYYNINLDYSSNVPKVKAEAGGRLSQGIMDVGVPEVTPVKFRKIQYSRKRWNILLPSINPEHVFGGISTAYKFFRELVERTGCDCRIILADMAPTPEAVGKYKDKYQFVRPETDSRSHCQILAFSDRAGRTMPVSENDYFIFTAWWTAYCIQEEYRNWEGRGLSPNPFIYFIQDYEPGFYAWSSRYMLADATYRTAYPQAAVFNSRELREYFKELDYCFDREFVFEPVLNDELKKELTGLERIVSKRKRILIYGRPNTQRNAFEIAVESLRKWVRMQEDAGGWEIFSAGELHQDVDLGSGKYLISLGKMSIRDYAAMLKETYAGISLMVSPHPSYPPLEMSVFGVKVVTNSYANKDLSAFNRNIVSLRETSPHAAALALKEICDGYAGVGEIMREENLEYCMGSGLFPFLDELIGYVLGEREL